MPVLHRTIQVDSFVEYVNISFETYVGCVEIEEKILNQWEINHSNPIEALAGLMELLDGLKIQINKTPTMTRNC